jgi:hypothetical protein
MISLPNNAVFTLIGAASVLLAFAADDSYDVADVVSADSSSRGSTSTKPFFMPAGCTCKISGASNDEQCGQFDCQCGCDVLAGACDINCCCDPECDSDDLASFSSCLDEGESTMTVRMCTESPPSLEVVNLKYPWRLVDSPEVRCIAVLPRLINSVTELPTFSIRKSPSRTNSMDCCVPRRTTAQSRASFSKIRGTHVLLRSFLQEEGVPISWDFTHSAERQISLRPKLNISWVTQLQSISHPINNLRVPSQDISPYHFQTMVAIALS